MTSEKASVTFSGAAPVIDQNGSVLKAQLDPAIGLSLRSIRALTSRP